MFFGFFGGDKKRAAELIAATKLGDKEKVRQLLAKGTDVNAFDPASGDTALIAAVDSGQAAIVEFLLDHRPNLDIKDNNGQTALYVAAAKGDAALPILAVLLKAGANSRLGPTEGQNVGATPLHLACALHANDSIRCLLSHKAPTDVLLPSGSTLMHAAALGGDKMTVRILCDAGVAIDKSDNTGRTPLHHAAISGNDVVAATLLESGAQVDCRDGDGDTPLIKAVLNNSSGVVKILLEHGADPEVVVPTGDSAMNPLYSASISGFDDIVRLLTDAGARVDTRVGGFASVIDLAKTAGHQSVVKLLKAAKKRQNENAAPGDEEAQVKASKRGTRRSSLKVDLGIRCSSIRYSEEEHGKNLPPDFKKAQAAWVKSGNDPTSASYKEACRLLGKWFDSDFALRLGLSMSMDVTENNQMGDAKDVTFKDASEAIAHAFKKVPKLKSLSVVATDFRGSSSSSPLNAGEKLLRSPDIGLVAVFQAELTKSFESAESFAAWMETHGALIAESFTLGIKDKAIETTVTDDDGETYTSVNASWSGGDFTIEINRGASTDDFLQMLVEKVREERRTPSLIGDSAPPLKSMFLLADECSLGEQLDGGLDPNTRIDDQPLVKYAMMIGVTADQWFDHDEVRGSLHERFVTIDDYIEALKRMAMLLLERGADVNAAAGPISIIAVATTLNDPVLLERCLASVASVNDINSSPFLLAAERGDLQSLRIFLARDARINKRDFLHGTTPLMLAAQGEGGEDAEPLAGEIAQRYEQTVEFLLENGADIDAVSDTGDTAIGNAVRRGNLGIVKLLLARGAKTREALPRGQRLDDLATERGHMELTRLLATHA